MTNMKAILTDKSHVTTHV